MALSLATIPGADCVMGNKKVKYRTVTLTSSYTKGGDALAPSDVGLRKIFAVEFLGGPAVVPGTLTGAFVLAASPVASSENWTISAYTAAGSPGTATALSEIQLGTNLSTYKVRIRVEGY